MSALSVQGFRGQSPAVPSLRFGSPAGADDNSVQWLLRRNCSMTPLQLVAFYLSLCAWSLAIAGAFWSRGATFVMPFATIEMLAIGAALFVYARHAGDRERVLLKPGRLTVECTPRSPHRPRRVRARLGPRRAGARRPLADRDLGRRQAGRDRPLRSPRAAPCARRRVARGAAPLRRGPDCRRRGGVGCGMNQRQHADTATPMTMKRALSRGAGGLLAAMAAVLAWPALAAQPNDLKGGPARQRVRPAAAEYADRVRSAVAAQLHAGHLPGDLHRRVRRRCSIRSSRIASRKARAPANFHESTTVEIAWTVVPFIIVILMALPATQASSSR